jgi:O-glycosyl hydrolase
MNSVSSFKGSLFVLLITGVTLIVYPLTSYAQNDACKTVNRGHATACEHPGAGCDLGNGPGSGSCDFLPADGACECGPPGRTQVATVTIDWNATHQTIDGFGSLGSVASSLYTWPEPQRSQIVDLAYSQANGIGLTILRSEIMPELEPSKGTWNYTDMEQVWLMKQAVNRGATKLFASVWSPPAWMKTNGDVVNGGSLKTENYQDFADFLSHYAAEYASANGVNIYAVSMTNEPNNSEPWRSCTWTSAQIASFLGNYLSPTFAANHIAAKVIAPFELGS